MAIFWVLQSCGCNNRGPQPDNGPVVQHREIADTISQHLASPRASASVIAWTAGKAFFGDSILRDKEALIVHYFDTYYIDSLLSHIYPDTSSWRSEFEGVRAVGDINRDGRNDTVFVMPAIFPDEDGDESYVFFDTSLPRLQVPSACCHPDNLFSIGDIDEDGPFELGVYVSSCVSHYKSLRVYTLKHGKWNEVGSCVYDLFFADTSSPYKAFIRKTGKGHFDMLEITDVGDDSTKIGKPNWRHFSFR